MADDLEFVLCLRIARFVRSLMLIRTRCIHSRSERLLMRKKEQTLREGSRPASAPHSHARKPQFSTRAHITAVLIEDRTCIQQAVEETRVPRKTECSAVPAADASNIGGRAQRRCKYARCTPLVPHPSLPPRKPSNPRHTLHLFMC